MVSSGLVSRSFPAAILLAAALLGAAVPARAAPERIEDRAYRLYREGDYAAAAALLEQLLARPGAGPELRRALASCYLKLHDDVRAAQHLRAYLAGAPPGPERTQAEARLAEVNERLGTTAIAIASDPPGAEVLLDAEPRPAGVTPLSLRVPLGPHRVRLHLAAHEEQTLAFEAKRGVEAQLAATMRPLVAPAPPVSPPPPDPGAVEDPVRTVAPVAPVAPPPPKEVRARPLRTAGIAAAALGGASGIAGLGLYLGSLAAADRASNAGVADDFFTARDASTTQYNASLATFSLAGVAGAAAAALFIADVVRHAPRRADARAGAPETVF